MLLDREFVGGLSFCERLFAHLSNRLRDTLRHLPFRRESLAFLVEAFEQFLASRIERLAGFPSRVFQSLIEKRSDRFAKFAHSHCKSRLGRLKFLLNRARVLYLRYF